MSTASNITISQNTLIYKIRLFLAGDVFTVILFALAAIVLFLNAEIPGAILFGLIICVVLILSDDLMSCIMPLLLLVSFAIRCKNSYDDFMEYIWVLPIPIFAILFHAIVYRKSFDFKKGKLLLPMCIASIATMTGGLGIITAEEYFSTISIAYMFTLGFGTVLVYLIFGAQLQPGKNYTENIDIRLSKIMITTTLFLSFAVLQYYGENIDKFILDPDILPFQWRNNACTILMIAMPFSFYMSTKKFPYIITAFLSYGTMLLSGSRGGMIFGGIELFILIVYFAIIDKKHRKFLLGIVVAIGVAVVLLLPKLINLFTYTIERLTSYSENAIRLGLLQRSVEDFLSNPLTGRGLGYMGNRDIHKSATATLCWYHSQIPQVIGSFGLAGVAAYGYQMFCRIKFFIAEKSLFAKTVFLSFIGLELMSVVNPGIFAPLYLMIITVLFSIVENYKLEGGYPEGIIHKSV